MPSNTTVVQLPRDYVSPPVSQHLKTFIEKSKEIRLEALRLDPSAFSSNLAREVAFDDSVWESRLKNPFGRTFIALDLSGAELGKDVTKDTRNQFNELDLMLKSPWIGTTVLMGPRICPGEFPADPWSAEELFKSSINMSLTESGTWKPTDGQDVQDINSGILMYVMNAVYVRSAYRGQGVGKKLVEGTLKRIRNEAIEGYDGKPFKEDRVCMVHVKSDNAPAKNMYDSLGFRTVRERPTVSKEVISGIVAVMRLDMN